MAGSIHKYQTKDGKSRYMTMLEVGESGKRKQKKKMGFKTKKEATAYLAEQQTSLIKGNYVEPSKTLLKDFILNWFNTIKKKSIRTSDNYEMLIKKYIFVYFEDVPLANLNSMHVDSFINKMHEADYSPATIRKTYNIINSSLDYAVEKGFIFKNVSKKATLPKDNKKEMLVWNKNEVNEFLTVVKGERQYILFYLALMTGMRQGELLGLRWKDIDFENNSLTVKQTLSHDAKEFYVGAKTKAGDRTITLSESTMKELKKHKIVLSQEKLLNGGTFNKYDLVICSEVGTPLNPSNIKRVMSRLVKMASVPKITFHSLRHTHATLLLANGINIKVISERLGHSNIKITLETYSHVLPTMQQEAVKKLDNLIGS